MNKITAAQQRFNDNVLLIASFNLIFRRLEATNTPIHRLGDIASTTSGGTPDRSVAEYYGGHIPWIKSGDLNDSFVCSAEEFITDAGLSNSSAKIFPSGTVVVALYGATTGKTGILQIEAASNQAVCAIFPDVSVVSQEFIFWFLRYMRPRFLEQSFGGAQPNISQKLLRDTRLPIPPLRLQEEICVFFRGVDKRQKGNRDALLPSLSEPLHGIESIVARIEELATKIEEAKGLRQQVSEESGYLTEVTIGSAFENVKESSKPLAAITSKIGSGSTPLGGRSGYLSSGIPFIRSLNVRMRRFQWADIAFIDEATHQTMRGTQVQPRDVLLNITGASIGRVACAPDDLVTANVNQHVAIIRPTDELSPHFLMYYLSQPKIQRFINEEQKGATRQGFTKAQIEAMSIPVPTLEEQDRIVTYLDALQAKADALKQLQAETAAELDALLPAVLDRAFRGEL